MTWKKWRHENKDRRISFQRVHFENRELQFFDFGDVEFFQCSFVECDLQNSNFRHAQLAGVNFEKSDLSYCSFVRSNLNLANLNDTILTEADFTGADLTGAQVNRAYLGPVQEPGWPLSSYKQGAKFKLCDLTSASFQDADFEKASFHKVILFETDFSGAKNLETTYHTANSFLDRSVIKKNPNLPQEFLTGLGLSVDEIQNYYEDYFYDTIIVEFTESLWGDLVPIEIALRRILGKAHVKKNGDRIVVYLKNREQYQKAFDAIIPVIAALDSIDPGSVRSVKIKPKDDEEEIVSELKLFSMLVAFHHQQMPAELPLKYASLAKAVEQIPFAGPNLALWLERWLLKEKGEKQDVFAESAEIYNSYIKVFELFKRLTYTDPKRTPDMLSNE
jgi:uncharacterized protein YjbI with pentapeptide repeats